MTSFTEEEEEGLINCVASHTVLFDTSDPNYRNISIKDYLWQEIGKQLNKDGDDCKKKWKLLRDGYHRFRKSHKLGKGPKNSKDKRHLLLSFLDSDPENRSSASNVPLFSKVLVQIHEEDSVDDRLSSNEQEVFNDGMAFYGDNGEYYSENNDDNKKAEVENQENTSLAVNKRGKKRKREIMKRKDDDIELFVRHIGEVLRNLPLLQKVSAKKHLFDVLSEYEIKAAQHMSSSSSPQIPASDQAGPSSASHVPSSDEEDMDD